MRLTKEVKTIAEAGIRTDHGYNLRFVYVEPGRILSTDGSMAFVYEIEDEDKFEPFYLDAKLFAKTVVENAVLTSEDDLFARVTRPDGTSDLLAKEERPSKHYEMLDEILPNKDTKVAAKRIIVPKTISKFLKAINAETAEITIFGPVEPNYSDKKERIEPMRLFIERNGTKLTGYVMPAVMP